MNQAAKLKLASLFTVIVTVLATAQGTFLTNPPFTENAIFVASTVITYLIMALTAWKQYLSPEISQAGIKVTLIAAIVATLAGLGDLVGIFKVSETTAQWIKWGISLVVMVLNIWSKGFFPSEFQKDKMAELKHTA